MAFPSNAFGQVPPAQAMSPFQFMAGGPIGMSLQQMQAQAFQPLFPGLGNLGPAGQMANQILSPIISSMFANQQMARGLLPMAGSGTAFQNMQQLTMMSRVNQSVAMATQRDLDARFMPMLRGIGMALGDDSRDAESAARAIVGMPGAGQFLPMVFGQFLPGPAGGTEAGLARALSFTMRGARPEEVAGVSQELFRQLSVGGRGRRIDLARTGGLGAEDIGALAFEMNRRNALALLPAGQVGDVVDEAAGEQGITLTGQQRQGAIQRLKATNIRSQLEDVADIVGIIRDMVGPNAPIDQILNALEGISGQTMGGIRQRPEQVRQQFQQLAGLANVMGIAPQAMLNMANATAAQFEAQGLPAQLGVSAAMQNITGVAGAQFAIAQGATPNVFGVSPRQIQRGVTTLQAGAITSADARMLGTLRALREAGAESAALQEFFGMDPTQRLQTLADPGARAQLAQDVRQQVDPRMMAMARRLGPEASQFLRAEDLTLLTARQGQEIRRVLTGRLREGGADEAADSLAAGETLTREQQTQIAIAGAGLRRFTRGVDIFSLLAVTSPAARKRREDLEALGMGQGGLITGINKLGREGPQGFLAALTQAGETGDDLSLMEMLGPLFGEQADAKAAIALLPRTRQAALREEFAGISMLPATDRKDELKRFTQELAQEMAEGLIRKASEGEGISPDMRASMRKQASQFFSENIREGVMKNLEKKPDRKNDMQTGEAGGSALNELTKLLKTGFTDAIQGVKQALNLTVVIEGLGSAELTADLDPDGNQTVRIRPKAGSSPESLIA